MSQVLYSPNEPEHFIGFFTSWILIRICPCGSGSMRHIFMRFHADPDPKHCIILSFMFLYTGTIFISTLQLCSLESTVTFFWNRPFSLFLQKVGYRVLIFNPFRFYYSNLINLWRNFVLLSGWQSVSRCFFFIQIIDELKKLQSLKEF